MAIETSDLTKSYGPHRGVAHLDLGVRAGEVFGFLGPNGSGKSTTMHVLVRLVGPTSGTATVLGLDCWRDRDRIARRVGFLPGEFSMYERFTGAMMLDYLSDLRGGASPRTRAELVDRFQVELHRPIRDLSMGNRQKLGLVQAFMHDPELVILDEPTLGLDPLIQREFHALVREIRDDGRTVFLSSHSLSEVERIADRVGIIRDGALVEVATLARLADLAVRRIDFTFAQPVPTSVFDGVDGVTKLSSVGTTVRVDVEGSVATVMKTAAEHDIVDLHIHETDLEDLFLSTYRGDQPTDRRDRAVDGGVDA